MTRRLLLAASCALACLATVPAGAVDVPAVIAAAVANPARPSADRATDEARKPAESLAFSGIKPGDVVVDMLPGRGYFTQLFCGAVGPTGHIYQLDIRATEQMKPMKPMKPMKMDGDMKMQKPAIPAPICSNVTKLTENPTDITLPQKADIIWTSRNYHDLHNAEFGKPDMITFDKQILAALKPGGVFIVLDHAAAAGSGASATETLHRIDPALVKQEATAAGFVFDGESPILRNPADGHDEPSFAMHGYSDQFLFRFRKPD